jgi:hypothetical protein
MMLYNEVMVNWCHLNEGKDITAKRRAPKEHLEAIMDVVRSMTFIGYQKLNNKTDAEVYGEVLFLTMVEIVDRMDLQKGSHFVDLGSGIGQLVLFAAASSECARVYGI